MRIVNLSLNDFNTFANNHTLRSYYQTSEYAKVMENKGYTYDYIGYMDNSNNLVAVSLSKTPVGIDVEKFEEPKKYITRIFSATERIEFDKLMDEQKWQYLITSWVMKESVYKMKGEGAFLPSKIDTSNENTVIEKMNLNNETYIFSIASEKNEIVQYFNNVKI